MRKGVRNLSPVGGSGRSLTLFRLRSAEWSRELSAFDCGLSRPARRDRRPGRCRRYLRCAAGDRTCHKAVGAIRLAGHRRATDLLWRDQCLARRRRPYSGSAARSRRDGYRKARGAFIPTQAASDLHQSDISQSDRRDDEHRKAPQYSGACAQAWRRDPRRRSQFGVAFFRLSHSFHSLAVGARRQCFLRARLRKGLPARHAPRLCRDARACAAVSVGAQGAQRPAYERHHTGGHDAVPDAQKLPEIS